MALQSLQSGAALVFLLSVALLSCLSVGRYSSLSSKHVIFFFDFHSFLMISYLCCCHEIVIVKTEIKYKHKWILNTMAW